MAEPINTQLGIHQYIGATNRDKNVGVALKASNSLLDDQDIFRTVSALQQAQDERSQSQLYRAHGTLNVVSFLTNRAIDWESLLDLVTHTNIRKVSEDFELCIGYVAKYEPHAVLGTGYYTKKMQIVAYESDIDIINCGFAKNIFSEVQNNFISNVSLDVSALVSTGLPVDWPVTDLIYYLRPKGVYSTLIPDAIVDANSFHTNTEYGYIIDEGQSTQAALATTLVSYLKPSGLTKVTDSAWSTYCYHDVVSLFQMADIRLTSNNIILNKEYLRAWIGLSKSSTSVTGENYGSDNLLPIGVCYFDEHELTFRDIYSVEYGLTRSISQLATQENIDYIKNLGYQYSVTNTTLIEADFKFIINPFKTFKIKDFSEFIERGNATNTINIPSNAIPIGDSTGDVVWRDILDPGFIEPTSKRGVSFPFLNGHHYTFANLTFTIKPDLTSYNSFRAFSAAKLAIDNPTFTL